MFIFLFSPFSDILEGWANPSTGSVVFVKEIVCVLFLFAEKPNKEVKTLFVSPLICVCVFCHANVFAVCFDEARLFMCVYIIYINICTKIHLLEKVLRFSLQLIYYFVIPHF
ncbi:unnamed protein product [Meloidogyne enterolobii]|uniref:Uncharacterized protein n=1 Tax=Meloidogyne enterolobii TaxID=390850 RepID=A0ACB0YRC1_MELEN